MSRKSQSQKKRHTKPCKFFQLNRCPHAAEVCDFAHVLVTPFSTAVTSICRYYYTGSCVHGALCKYRHGEALSSFKTQEVIPEWRTIPSPESTHTDPTPGFETLIPYAQRWQSMPFYSPPTFSPQSPESLIFSPSSRSRDSIQSLDTLCTSNTSLESDDVMIVTEDPQYEEHPHSHQSQIYIADENPIIHVSPFHHAPLYVNTAQPTPLAYDYAYANIAGAKSRQGNSKSPSKQKALKYKTKPCKFWSTDKGCPNGSACTFMHDEKSSRSSSPVSPQALPAEKEKDDSPRKNFVPIQWRVIGGGVLVSMAKKEGDDGEKFNPDIDCSLPLKPPNTPLPPLKIITRPRSNSIPPTPSITQINVEHLFSAESPGVL